MADKNILMKVRNSTNTAWDNIYPRTKLANIIDYVAPASGGVVDKYYVPTSQDVNTGGTDTVYTSNCIPIMTSNSQDGYVASGSGTSSTSAFNAFDGNLSSAWTSNTSGSGWVQIKLPYSLIAKSFKVLTLGSSGYFPVSWAFQGSIDGTSWVTLYDSGGTAMSTTITSFTVSNTTAYSYYRINVGSTASSYPKIAEFNIDGLKVLPVYKTQFTLTTGKITSYTNDMRVMIHPATSQYIGDNTTTIGMTPTINIDGLGAKSITGSYIKQGETYELRYDSTLGMIVSTLIDDKQVGKTFTLSQPATSFVINNLDINADGGFYEIQISGLTSSATSSIEMYINGDSTATNYYNYTSSASNTAITGINLHSSTSYPNEVGYATINLFCSNGNIWAYIISGWKTGYSNCTQALSSWCKIANTSNINTIMFSTSSGSINTGTIKIYKR